jgi:hypothetical protein
MTAPLSVLESQLALANRDEEAMAHRAPNLDELTPEECERIARVAYRISQVEAMRGKRVLPSGLVIKPWSEFSARERTEAVATVKRVFQAGQLLGWFEAP